MKPKTLILMVVAVTCGLGASYMTSRLLAQRGQSDENETVAVWVAAKNIDQGTLLKKAEELFVAKEFLRGSEPKDGIQKIEDIKGKILKRPLRAGDPARADDVLKPEEAGMQYILPAGHLAIGVRVNQANSAAGWATLPLNRVDLYATVRRGDDNSSFCQVLLEDVLVLAVDTSSIRDEQGRAMPGNTAVLALKPEDVLKVEIAKEMGPISLALRKYGDKVKYDAGKTSFTQLMTKQEKKDEEVARAGDPPLAAAPKLPDFPKDTKAADIRIFEDPHNVHKLTITEGEHRKVVEYFLNDKGEVIPRDVSRTEVPRITPSTPPSVGPPSLTAPTPSVGKKD